MSLSRADVELLDRNLQELTDTGLKRQGLKIAQQRADQEHEAEVARELNYRRMLEAEERRAKAAEAKDARDQEGETTVYLQGPKGGTFEYKGSRAGLQKWLDQGSKIVDKPSTAKMGRYEWKDPHGATVTFDLNTPEDLSKVQQLAQSSGGYGKNTGFQTAPIANDTRAAELRDQARQTRAQAATVTGPEGPYVLDQARDLERRANAIQPPPKAPAEPMQDVSTEIGGLNEPKVTVRRRVPASQDPRSVFSFSTATNPPPSTAAATAPTIRNGSLPTVSSQAEYDALPSGSRYINKGKTYVKP